MLKKSIKNSAKSMCLCVWRHIMERLRHKRTYTKRTLCAVEYSGTAVEKRYAK